MIQWLRVHGWWLIGLGLAGYKLSLLRSQHIYAIGNAHHDEALFMKLAGHIVRGEWLGPYDQFTLSKGPAYPIFIAMNFWTGLPLALTQQLLYLVACLIAVWALAPIIKWGGARLAVLLLLFYNPLTYEGEHMTRILRQHLTVPLALIVVAGLIALALRRKAFQWDVTLPWAALTGGALGVFLLTREEGIWIFPAVVMVALALLVWAGRQGVREAARMVAAWAVLGLTAWLPGAWVSAQNLAHYGWYGTVDYKAAAFEDAVGALTRVEIGPDRPYVQVNREARDAIYAVSPAFAELRPHLEAGPVAEKWMEKTAYAFEERQYLTGWFGWALRDAISAAGYGTDPQTLLDFCARLADEVNEACEDGRLEAGRPRSGFLPRWHKVYGEAMASEWRKYWNEALQLTRFETIVPESVGSDDEIRPFVDLSYDNLSPAPRATYFHKPDQIEQNRVKIDRLRALGVALSGYYATLIKLGLVLLLIRGFERLIRRRWSWLTWLATAVAVSIAAELAINFLVHTMAFDNFYPAAWAPAYPLFLLVFVLIFADISDNWIRPGWRRLRSKIQA
jgi:hypothetical protein